ncbi:MAG: histidine phosphatase family protein [Chloroflexota bacterium]
MMAHTLYLIRHATPDWDRKDIPYHLPPGPELTVLGQAEARALGAYLCETGVQRLYASPLERTLRTACIAGEAGGAQVIVDERLSEWQPGESLDEVSRRILPAVDEILAEAAGRPVGLVTHGGPVEAILLGLGMALPKDARRYDRGNLLPPAGAWRADYHAEQGGWRFGLVFIPQAALHQLGS